MFTSCYIEEETCERGFYFDAKRPEVDVCMLPN